MKLYVYYHPDDGSIKSIGPEPMDSGLHVVMDDPVADDLYLGKKLIAKYRVVHGILTDHVTDLLVQHGALPLPVPTIHNFSHQQVFRVPTVADLNKKTDICIDHNTATKEITFTLGPWADARAISVLRMYLTDRDDVYCYRHEVVLRGLKKSKTVSYTGDLSNCSAWTYRIFETYQYREHHTHAVFGLRRFLHKLRRTELRKALGRLVGKSAMG